MWHREDDAETEEAEMEGDATPTAAKLLEGELRVKGNKNK